MITPYLLYQDVAGAIRFLSKAFGFKKSGSTMLDKNGKLIHAAMKLGDDLIMMGYPGPRYKNQKKLGEATQMLYVTVKDADDISRVPRKREPRFLKSPKIRSTAIGGMVLRTPKDINGISSTKSRHSPLTNTVN